MAVLTLLRQLPGGYSERGASPPLHLGLGLYQGGRLGAAGDMAYRRALNTLMVPPLMARMEQQIGESFGNPEYLYQALKFYLMMTTPEHRDPELLKVWIARDWKARYPGATTAAFRQSFREHLDALLEDELNPVPAGNPALIAQARQALAQLPLASRVYAQLKAEQHSERTDGWTLAGTVPADDLRYFRRRSNTPFSEGLPRLYTVDGYQQVFVSERDALVSQVVQEAWVLGPGYARSDDERSGLERKVEELYLADYARLWEAFLDDIEMQQGSNVEQQADLVRAIMTPDSPAKTVLAAIAGQTALAQAIASREQQEMDPQQLQRFRDRVGRWLGRADAAASQPVATAGFVDPALKVDQRFRQLHALLQSDGKTPPRIDTALADLTDLYDYLVQAMHQKTLGPDAVAGLHEIVARGNAVIGRIESLANAQPQPLRGWLASTTETSRALTIGKAVGGAQQQVKEAWASSVGPECRAALASRYPFDRNAGLFVNLNDFTRLFGPGGVIEGFAQTYILPFADTSVRPWRWRREGAGLRGLSSEALRMFEQAGRIREAFFAQSGGSLGFGFEIEPVSLDHRARQVVLELGDQRITYQHGPRRPTRVEWPQRGPGASITFTTPGLLGQTIMASERGPWAWLKLLDAAHVRRSATPDRFRVLFDVSGYRAEFDVRSDSIINPFFLPELEQFRCLERL
jgi:type VI secretion system protein ImpL